jgi:hypothetical protein
MGGLVRKLATEALLKAKRINPSDPLTQDAGAWIIDMIKFVVTKGM